MEIMGKKQYIWLAVTADEYELPIAIADTAKELGAVFGVSANSVITCVTRQHDGRENGYKYVKVRSDE